MTPKRPPAASRRAGASTAAAWLQAVALAVLASLPAAAQGADTLPPPMRPDLPLDLAQAGMPGYLLTEGPDGLLRVPLTLVGLQGGDALTLPLLLVRLSDDTLAPFGGVAAGMSGSPVYLGAPGQERLAGALAYAFPNSDHDLALVTPIEAMRLAAAPSGTGSARPVADPPATAVPVATPLLLHGLDERAAAALMPVLQAAGLRPIPVAGGAQQAQAGASGQAQANLDESPAAGHAVAALLAWGDVRIAAVGTVTDRVDETGASDRDGARFIGLGHPLLRRDAPGYAAAAAEVLAIVPSRLVPFKLVNIAAQPFGAVTRDGVAGLVGTVGDEPDGLPVSIRIDAPQVQRTLALRIANDPGLAPAVLAAVVTAAIDEARDAIQGGTAELAWTFEFQGEPELRMLDQRVHERDLASDAALLAAAPLAVLMDNPFRAPRLQRLALHLTLHDAPVRSELVHVALETPEVEAGGTVVAFLRLQPFRGEPEVRTVRFTLPSDVEPGVLRLTFRGASVPDPEEQERVPPEVDPLKQPTSGLPPVLSWAELLAALAERPQARELLVEIPGDTRPRRLARIDVGAPLLGLERVSVQVRDSAPEETP